MTGLKELYEDALEWLNFEQASDDIHWYARRVVKAFEKEAQSGKTLSGQKEATNRTNTAQRRIRSNGNQARQMSFL